MQREGAQVKAFEPHKPDARFDQFETVPTLEEAWNDAEVIVLLVGHTMFKQLDPRQVAAQTPARIIVDMRGVLDRKAWQAEGFVVFTLGVGSAPQKVE
jgi:UDP-N-acetyl-D-mannosaminuronic acid dehydrogenase